MDKNWLLLRVLEEPLISSEMNDEIKNNPSKTVLNCSRPPWFQHLDMSKISYGFVGDLEAQSLAKYEADRLAYKEKHPESYVKWEAILRVEAEAREAVFNAPSLEIARAAAAAATAKAGVEIQNVLEKRIEGADKIAERLEKARAKRTTITANVT